MLITDDDRRHVDANTAACRALGIPPEALRALRIDDLTPPERRPALAAMWSRFLVAGSLNGEHELLLPGGRSVLVRYVAFARCVSGLHLTIVLPVCARDDAMVSEREREVLELLATGATAEDIAKALTIASSTVRTHIRNVREKLGATTRAHLVALAFQAGLLPLFNAERSGGSGPGQAPTEDVGRARR